MHTFDDFDVAALGQESEFMSELLDAELLIAIFDAKIIGYPPFIFAVESDALMLRPPHIGVADDMIDILGGFTIRCAVAFTYGIQKRMGFGAIELCRFTEPHEIFTELKVSSIHDSPRAPLVFDTAKHPCLIISGNPGTG